ncbi:MAG: CaiB/BaiF CoA-transferase family protein [Pseudomonadota bacterium]|nr:CaiB/BaiF CoA-transferase family protein [Pseudomonadota bacterium]
MSPQPASRAPLQGLRILEMEALGPLPHAGTSLAAFGADVVRITRPGGVPFDPAVQGRRSIAIDLKSPAGREALLSLVTRADALLEGFRPGAMERLGLGPAECHAVNPTLVYGRMTGWGQSGPLAQEAGHDINYIAVAGVLGRIARPGERPQVPLNVIGDYGGGSMNLLFGLMVALWQARACGQGAVIDAAMVDGAASLMAKQFAWAGLGALGEPGTNLLDGGAHFYDTYECADGRYIALGAIEPKFYAALLRVLGIDPDDLPPQDDRSRWPEARRIFAARILTRTRDDWVARAAGHDACLSPVLTLEEAANHPHAIARGGFRRDGDGAIRPQAAPRLDTAGPCWPAPEPDETDSAALLAEWGRRALTGNNGKDNR